MGNSTADLRFALRTFRKSPVFVVVALLSLALGIGANTAIFTLVDQLLLRLLPVKNPEQLVTLWGRGDHYGGNNGPFKLSYPMYEDLPRQEPGLQRHVLQLGYRHEPQLRRQDRAYRRPTGQRELTSRCWAWVRRWDASSLPKTTRPRAAIRSGAELSLLDHAISPRIPASSAESSPSTGIR